MLNFILAVSLLFSGAPLDWWNDTGVMHDPAPAGGATRWEGGNSFTGNQVIAEDNRLIYHGRAKIFVGDPTVTQTSMMIKLLSIGSYLTEDKDNFTAEAKSRGRISASVFYRCAGVWALPSGFGAGAVFSPNYPNEPTNQQVNAYTQTFEFNNTSLISQCAGSVENIEMVQMVIQQNQTTGPNLGSGVSSYCDPPGTNGTVAWRNLFNTQGENALPECATEPASFFNTMGGSLKVIRIYAGVSEIKQSNEMLTMGECFRLFSPGEIFPNRKVTLAGVEYTALQLGCTRMTDEQLEDYYNSFEYLCRDAPEWSWTDPSKIAPWTFHYAKCLTVPENINTATFNDALDGSFIGQIKNINWSFGTSSASDCGPLISQDIMNSNLSINTCDWKEKIPGVMAWRDRIGYIFVGLIAISAVFFIFRIFGGSKQ